MNRLLATALVFAFASFAAFGAEPNTLTAEEKAAGWKLLFDGKTSAGWVAIGKNAFPENGWSIVDGALVLAKAAKAGDIVTAENYENFELVWEWKIGAAGNSGLKYNLPNPAKNVGFEYQMIDDEGHPDGAKGGRSHQTAGLYDLIEPSADKKTNPIGEWNGSRLVVRGNHVEHWLNGAKTVEFEIGSDALKEAIAKSKYKKIEKFGEKTASPILLQDHGDEVAVRSIKLRVLDAK
jgi:hypothetical protein